MTQEDRQAIRTFYQTLATSGGSATQAQIDFYFQVLKGNAESRKAWFSAYVQSNGEYLPLAVLSFVRSDTKITKQDLAFIAASAIAPKLPGFLSKLFNALFGWLK
jgi:hypothetical protein